MIDSASSGIVWIDRVDMEKVKDALALAHRFFKARDEMNAQVHSAAEVRYSPITSRVEAELQRVQSLLLR